MSHFTQYCSLFLREFTKFSDNEGTREQLTPYATELKHNYMSTRNTVLLPDVKRSGFKHNTRNFLPVNLHHTFFRRHTVTVRENKPSISPALTEQISVHFHPRAAMRECAT